MSTTDPPTPSTQAGVDASGWPLPVVAGEVIESAWGNAVVNSLNKFRLAPRARVYRTTTQSIPNVTQTAHSYNAQRVNVGNMHSTTVNNQRFTIALAGWYHIGTQVRFAASSAGMRQVGIRINGNSFIAVANQPANTANAATDIFIDTYWQLAAGEYVETVCYQNSGASLTTMAAPPAASEYWITWVAP